MSRDRILLSNSPLLTELLQKAVFRRKNCRFFLASTGEEAWALMERENPDIAFLDFHLPGMDEVLCRRIKADPRFQDISIVAVVTGREDLKRLREGGCDDILVGPLKRHRLTWLTRRLLRLPVRSEQRLDAALRIRYGASPADVHTARTLNLGTGGVLIQALQPLPSNTPILIELSLPGGGPPIRCRGRIAWLGNPVAGEGTLREMGVEFLGLSPDDKDRIRNFIESEGVRLPA